MREVIVGRGTVEVSDDPDTVLGTAPLGAGLAVIAFHSERKIGGILHAALPREVGRGKVAAIWPGLFVSTGIQLLLSRLKGLGVERDGVQLRIAGASELLHHPNGMMLGQRNVAMARLTAWLEALPIIATRLGGSHSLSVRLYVANGAAAVLSPVGDESL